jgi:hypothetical protein
MTDRDFYIVISLTILPCRYFLLAGIISGAPVYSHQSATEKFEIVGPTKGYVSP